MMPQRYDSYYRSRPRSRREEPQGDAVVVALTVQIIVCIMLLLAANVVKKTDEAAYSRFRKQFDTMATDTAQGSRFASIVTSWTAGSDEFFTAVEKAIVHIVTTITGNKQTAEEQLLSSASEDSAVEENMPEANSAHNNYSYLEAVPSISTTGGRGGMQAVDADITQPLSAPDGSSLAPVMLGGTIKPPVTGLITSKYAYRYHPISQNVDFHTGIDIAAEEGRSILAALPGEVVEVGESDIYGKYIILQHATNLKTFYAHCSSIIASEGMAVRQGERIARVGQTGTATGPHLHFSVIVDETFTDPFWVLGDNIQVVE